MFIFFQERRNYLKEKRKIFETSTDQPWALEVEPQSKSGRSETLLHFQAECRWALILCPKNIYLIAKILL